MSNAIVRIVRREIYAVQNRRGMQAGLPKVTIEASHAEYLCKLAEQASLAAERERNADRWIKSAMAALERGGSGSIDCALDDLESALARIDKDSPK